MKPSNPFPGMNPFLEGFWSDVHTALIVYISEAIAECLPEGLKSRCAEFCITDVETERWIEISDCNGRLVTVIEVLSPVNKDSGRDKYIAKRQSYLAGGVNVVEIDLLRAGYHVVGVPKDVLRDQNVSYITCVTRAANPARKEYYQTPLNSALPNIRIPLRQQDQDAVLPLQLLVDRCYRMGGYWNEDHQHLLGPALSVEDTAWVAEKVKAAGFVV